ncbi:MAG: DNA internalization-related competence protein ComEC/Rec2 [Bacilli bacterium]|nr:DNA internalization-related competence protein ComEC/Rec2 [Bacilli bacterium]
MEILFTKKLKLKLLYSIFIIITVINFLNIILNDKTNFKYNLNINQISGIVTNYKIDGNKLTLEIKNKSKIIGNYYFKTERDLKKYRQEIKLGINVILYGNLEKISQNTNFNLFNYQKYLYSKKIYYMFNINELKIEKRKIPLIYNIKNDMLKRSNKLNFYLNLFIFGENSLDDEIIQSYRKNGISHLFAISGMHITLFTTILLKILNLIKINYKKSGIIIILFLFFYMFLTNYSPSVMRASFLFIFLFIKKIFNLKTSNLNIMIILICLFLLYNPYYIYNTGFVFSFLISFSLILFSNIINKFNNYFIKVFITSYISFLVSIPILINNFNEINFLSPFVNIIFVPFISIIIFPLSLLTFIISPLNVILNIITNLLEKLSILISKINYFTIILSDINIIFVIFYYIIIVFVIININKIRYIIILGIILFFHSNINLFNKYPIITMLDVNQGDSILLQLPNNKANILIDTGGITNYNTEKWMNKKKKYSLSENVIIPYLKSVGIKKLHYLILTHGDFDHVGEAVNLINNFNINKIIMNSGNNNSLEKNIINQDKKFIQKSKYNLKIGNYILYFINDKDKLNENEDSLIIYMSLNNKNILFMGDSGEESENYILNEYNLPKMDILKVGHHGSKYSSSINFLNKIKPSIAIISAGKNNRFNHPNIETIDKLKKLKTNIFVTKDNGMIKIILRKKIIVKTVFDAR